MKKPLLMFFLLVAFLIAPRIALAQEDMTLSPTVSSSDRIEAQSGPTATPTPDIVYDMPYPGLLPDNPLYIFKAARDQIVGFLISDPSKKATFDLLQADKRFQAGMILLQKDPAKRDVAIATLSKGQNYYDQAIDKVQEAKKQNVETGDISGKIIASGQKQQGLLKDFSTSHPDLVNSLDSVRQRLSNLQQKANLLRSRSES